MDIQRETYRLYLFYFNINLNLIQPYTIDLIHFINVPLNKV